MLPPKWTALDARPSGQGRAVMPRLPSVVDVALAETSVQHALNHLVCAVYAVYASSTSTCPHGSDDGGMEIVFDQGTVGRTPASARYMQIGTTHTYAHPPTHTRTHTYTCTHTVTHTDTQTHTHTHTHTLPACTPDIVGPSTCTSNMYVNVDLDLLTCIIPSATRTPFTYFLFLNVGYVRPCACMLV